MKNDGLTEREIQIRDLIVKRGMTNREIAKHLFISISTVKNHVSSIIGKLDIKSRAQFASTVIPKEETITRIIVALESALRLANETNMKLLEYSGDSKTYEANLRMIELLELYVEAERERLAND